MDRQGRIAVCASALILVAGSLQAAGIYQWRDDQGRLHFGDAPGMENATDLSKQYDYSLPFEIVFEPVDYRVPPQVRDKLTTSISKIFTVYKQALEIDYPQNSEFRIRIYGSEQAYRAYQQKVAPVLENSAAFYNSASNQITTWGMDEPVLRQVVTHECSHAVSASGGRNIPIWLNEGLATYFETMQVSGQSVTLPLSEYWLQVLRKRGYTRNAPDLRLTLDSAHAQWYSANGADNQSYALSWSLVWFMMDSETGREILRQLLHRDSHLFSLPSSQVIDKQWPGGFASFRQDWQSWLRSARTGAHRY